MTPEQQARVIDRIVMPTIRLGGERYRRALTENKTVQGKLGKLRKRSNKLTLEHAIRQSIDGARNADMGNTRRDVALALIPCHTGVESNQAPRGRQDPHRQLIIRSASGGLQAVRLDVGSQKTSKNKSDQERASDADLITTGAIALRVHFSQDEHSGAPREGLHEMTGPEYLTWLGIGGHEFHQEVERLINREYRACREYEQDLEQKLLALLQVPRDALPAIQIPAILVPLACPNAELPQRIDIMELISMADAAEE